MGLRPLPQERDPAEDAVRDVARHDALVFAGALVENLDLDRRYTRLAEVTAQVLAPS